MEFTFDHVNINIVDIEKSLSFYEKALNMREVSRKEASDGSFILVFLGDPENKFKLELTWLRDKDGTYELGDNETHLCFRTGDYDAAHKLHEQMGVICYENTEMGLYFIEDPDGYWIEIVPRR